MKHDNVNTEIENIKNHTNPLKNTSPRYPFRITRACFIYSLLYLNELIG